MARKKLNKKIAILGSVVLVLFLLGGVLVLLRLTEDPDEWIREGQAAQKQKDYETAAQCYREAYGAAHRDDEKRIEIAHILAKVYVKAEEWPKAVGTLKQIVTMEPENIEARRCLLDYFYEYADSGMSPAWREVQTHATELLDIQADGELYFRRGKARYELARRGQTAERTELLSKAKADLRKVIEQQPQYVEAYSILAQAIALEGEMSAAKGAFEQEADYARQAEQFLEQALEAAPDNPESHINLLQYKAAQAESSDERKQLEGEFTKLTREFPSSAKAYSALAMYYLRLGRDHLDEALMAANKAQKLDQEEVTYLIMSARLLLQKASHPWDPDEVLRAVETAKKGLQLRGAQDIPGPREAQRRQYRYELNSILANCYVELAMRSQASEQKQEAYLSAAEEAVNQIQQILGSGEHPYAVMWNGLVKLARGESDDAIRKLYDAYERLKAMRSAEAESRVRRETRDPQFAYLCYKLSEAFRNRPELGARIDFLQEAITAGIVPAQPEVILDYAELAVEANPQNVLRWINSFEEEFGANSRSSRLRLRAQIAAGQFDEAEKQIARLDPESPDTIESRLSLVTAKMRQAQLTLSRAEKSDIADGAAAASQDNQQSLQAELDRYRKRRKQLIDKLIESAPEKVAANTVVAVSNDYRRQDDTARARQLVSRYLQKFPDNILLKVQNRRLQEPDALDISEERLNEIALEVINAVSDPVERARQLAMFYAEHSELDAAIEQCKAALETAPEDRQIADSCMRVALENEDFSFAEELIASAARNNSDMCEGQLFGARLALARQQYEEAKMKLDRCLDLRPLTSLVYLVRSAANQGLGNREGAIDDARTAVSLEPNNAGYARQLASLLYERDRMLGDSVTADQREETKRALRRAVSLSGVDEQLLSVYAGYISEDEPENALAYRQQLQQNSPSIENSVMLGRLATRLAYEAADEEQKQALLNIASSAYEKGYSIDPTDKRLLASWAEYYRKTGEVEKADQLIERSGDKELAWSHYVDTGRHGKARDILQRLYEADSDSSEIVRGLLILANRTNDAEGVSKYSDELVSLEDSPANRLFQIQSLVNAGLTEEAEKKLEAFEERYPQDKRSMLFEASLKTKQGQYDVALELLNNALQTTQGNAAAWRLRGRLNYLQGNYTQAVNDLQKSKSIQPSAQVRVDLARVYRRAQRVEDAIAELRAAIDDQGSREAKVMLTDIYRELGRAQQLVDVYNQALEENPEDVFWHNRAATFLYKAGNVDQASRLWKEAWNNSQRTGGDLESLDGYLMSLQAQKKYDELLSYASEHIDGPFATAAYSRMASVKAAMGQTETAAAYYQTALKKAGADNSAMLEILGRMYSTLGRDATVQWCTNRLREEPDNFVANLAMYHVMAVSGDFNSALEYIAKCMTLAASQPNAEPLLESLSTYKTNLLQRAYLKTRDTSYLDAAIKEFESILEKKPNKADALNNLAYMLAIKDRELDRALECARQARKLEPTRADFIDTHAFVQYKRGDQEKAAEIQRSAVQLYEQQRSGTAPAEAYDTLAKIVEKLGLKQEALAAYKQALEVGQNQLAEQDKIRIKASISQLEATQ